MTVTPLLVLKVMGRPPDLHHGKHWTRWDRAREQGMRRSYIKVLAQGERHRARMEPATEKRRLHIIVWWWGPRRDTINLLQDLKADIDGLVDAGWLLNDNEKFMQLDLPPDVRYAVSKAQVAIEYELYPVTA